MESSQAYSQQTSTKNYNWRFILFRGHIHYYFQNIWIVTEKIIIGPLSTKSLLNLFVCDPQKTLHLKDEVMLAVLAMHLLQKHSTQVKPIAIYKGGLSPHKLHSIENFIEDNLDREIFIDELAELTQLSRYHFSRSFKLSIGITPYQYVIRQRVERAKKLLLQGNMTIIEIAIACGFTHQSHLNRHFKRLTGLTPKKFEKCCSQK